MVNIKNIFLSYKADEMILNDISLTVKKGECVLFTGRSGSGKSSIINSINGLAARYDDAVVNGDITIDDKNIKKLELYEIAMLVSSVFQNPKTHFFNINTTLELLFYLENTGVSKEEMDIRLSEMLKVFPIEHLLNRDIFMLSGGEKQILSIAASYISGTSVIVLDEPSSNLDDENIRIVSNMLTKLKSKGITILVCEHRIFYLMEIVDRILLVQDGKIINEYEKEAFLKLSQKELNDLGLRDKFKTEIIVPNISNEGTLEVKSIEFCFGATSSKLNIKNLAFESGKIYGVTGMNGLGKSTFIKCLIGLERKSKDEIYLDGEKLSKKDRLKMSSLVMQDVNHQLFTDSVINEVSLAIKDIQQSKVESILDNLGLSEFKDRHPMSLSGGQKQRAAIASVMCKDSKFMFFDEPTSGMDYANMMKISGLIKNCKRSEKIIFIVSHDTEFLNATADYIVDMKRFQENRLTS